MPYAESASKLSREIARRRGNRFRAKYGWLGKNGRTLQVLNEPNGYNDIAALVAWTCEVIRLASATNVSLTVMNLGVGHPNLENPTGVLEQWDARFEPVLRLLAQHRDKHYLGLHEYLPSGNTYRVGRFTRVLALCHKYNLAMPRIIITEWGVDSNNGEPEKLGYRARGWTAQQYIAELMRVYREVYMPWVTAGVIVGMCIFSYGNSGGWEAFDVRGQPKHTCTSPSCA